MKKFLKAKDTKAAIAACPALTADGAAAIYLFTCESPLYHQLNEKLRARNRAELKVSQTSRPAHLCHLDPPPPRCLSRLLLLLHEWLSHVRLSSGVF